MWGVALIDAARRKWKNVSIIRWGVEATCNLKGKNTHTHRLMFGSGGGSKARRVWWGALTLFLLGAESS